jgi:Mg2+-importing ATPase
MVLAVWLPYSPFAPALGFVPLPGVYWLWIGAFLASYAVMTHFVKSWFMRKYGEGL